ncbi:MAG: ATP-binding protein [Terriglobales bacterium]
MTNRNINEVEEHYKELLLKAESRFRKLCEGIPVGFLILNMDGMIEFINRKTQTIFQLELSRLVGREFYSLLQEPPAKPFSDFAAEVAERGGSIELDACGGDEHNFPIEVTLRDFEMFDRPCLLAAVMDISERRAVEKLRQEIIAMVSHDLSTPLTSIQITLNLLSTPALGQLNERGLNLVSKAERSTTQLIKLINDLLAVETLESGKVSIYPERINMGELFSHSHHLVEELARSKGVEIDVVPVGNVEIFGDKDRLQQVIVNFLSNAIKFSPEHARVELSAEAGSQCTIVRVKDNGRGVPQKDQERIFERFHQVESSDAREKGGRGLGLAICKAIVTQHGGRIGVTSEEGNGSTFWFEIPAKK